MFEFQSHLIFPVHAVPAAGPLPPRATTLSLRTPDGETLHGISIPADGSDVSRTLILGFGGNAWNGQDVAEYLHELFPDHEVVAFHYRGYPPSTGSPSAEALIADAPLVYDAAIDRAKPVRVIAIGFSIGTGVAAQLSASRKFDGLILVTPFDSLKGVAQSMYPWLPIGPLFAHEIDAATPCVRLISRLRSSLPSTTRSSPANEPKRFARSFRTWSTTARSLRRGTTTFTLAPTFTKGCGRHSPSSAHSSCGY